MPDVVPQCVLPNGDNGMSHQMSFDCVLPKGLASMPLPTWSGIVCYPWAMITATHDVIRLCMLSKGNDDMPHLMSFDPV